MMIVPCLWYLALAVSRCAFVASCPVSDVVPPSAPSPSPAAELFSPEGVWRAEHLCVVDCVYVLWRTYHCEVDYSALARTLLPDGRSSPSALQQLKEISDSH